MDTCTKRPYPKNDITPAQQFDMLKELGYAGIAWTEEPPEQVNAAVDEAEASGLKMFAIYCSATVTRGRHAQAVSPDRADHGGSARPRHLDLAAHRWQRAGDRGLSRPNAR